MESKWKEKFYFNQLSMGDWVNCHVVKPMKIRKSQLQDQGTPRPFRYSEFGAFWVEFSCATFESIS